MAPDTAEKPIRKPVSQKSKAPVFKTGNPYTASRWPTIDPQLQENILDNLCELLSPIGDWRATIPRSKGKRQKQRDRKRKRNDETVEPSIPLPTPRPAPLIEQYVTIGHNSTVRAISPDGQKLSEDIAEMAVVFLTHSVDSIEYAHLPVLAAQSKPPVDLIPLADSEARLCAATGLPRIGLIGVRADAPGISALMALIADVEPVQVPFLDEVRKGEWLGVNIENAQLDKSVK